jgi:DNA-binding response OmpR family regulator
MSDSSEPTADDRPVEVSLVSAQLAVRVGSEEVAVTRTQFRLLSVLLAQPGRAFSRRELVETGIESLVTERTVDVHIKELRRKLGRHGSLIQTVRGHGYRWGPALAEALRGVASPVLHPTWPGDCESPV